MFVFSLSVKYIWIKICANTSKQTNMRKMWRRQFWTLRTAEKRLRKADVEDENVGRFK